MKNPLENLSDSELESAYREQGSSDQGAQLQRLLFRHCQKQGVTPEPGKFYIIGGNENAEI